MRYEAMDRVVWNCPAVLAPLVDAGVMGASAVHAAKHAVRVVGLAGDMAGASAVAGGLASDGLGDGPDGSDVAGGLAGGVASDVPDGSAGPGMGDVAGRGDIVTLPLTAEHAILLAVALCVSAYEHGHTYLDVSALANLEWLQERAGDQDDGQPRGQLLAHVPWVSDVSAWSAILLEHRVGVSSAALDVDPSLASLLVLDDARWYLRTMYAMEQRVAKRIVERLQGGRAPAVSATSAAPATPANAEPTNAVSAPLAAPAHPASDHAADRLARSAPALVTESPHGLVYVHTGLRPKPSLRAALEALAEPHVREDGTSLTYPAEQQDAVRAALGSRCTLITGGPGTGKTTTIATILRLATEHCEGGGVTFSPPGQASEHGEHDGESVNPADQAAEHGQHDNARLSPDAQVTYHTPRLAIAALSGKAATRVKQAIDEEMAKSGKGDLLADVAPVTLTRLLKRGWNIGKPPVYTPTNPLPYDMVIVDEMSMVSLDDLDALLHGLHPETHLVLVGDPNQLQSITVGTTLHDVLEGAREFDGYVDAPATAGSPEPATAIRYEHAAAPGQEGDGRVHTPDDRPGGLRTVIELKKNYRSEDAIIQLANAVMHDGVDACLERITRSQGKLTFVEVPDTVHLYAGNVGQAWLEHLLDTRRQAVQAATNLASITDEHEVSAGIQEAMTHSMRYGVFAFHNEGQRSVGWFNALLERTMAKEPGVQRVSLGGRSIWPGQPIMVTANNQSLRVYNGDIGLMVSQPQEGDTPVASHAGQEGVAIAIEGKDRLFSPHRLRDVTTMHAMTVHKSQGSQFEHVAIILPLASSPLLSKQSLYTAITRAKQGVIVVGSRESFERAVNHSLTRASYLAERIKRLAPVPEPEPKATPKPKAPLAPVPEPEPTSEPALDSKAAPEPAPIPEPKPAPEPVSPPVPQFTMTLGDDLSEEGFDAFR